MGGGVELVARLVRPAPALLVIGTVAVILLGIPCDAYVLNGDSHHVLLCIAACRCYLCVLFIDSALDSVGCFACFVCLACFARFAGLLGCACLLDALLLARFCFCF